MNTEATSGAAEATQIPAQTSSEATEPPATVRPPCVQHLVHVLCLPMQVKRKGCPVAAIDDITAQIGSVWHEVPGGTPWATLEPEQAWQARVYFHPFVRRFLFDPQRVRWLQRTDVVGLRAELASTWGSPALVFDFKVTRCLLVLFQPDIACLLLELDYTAGVQGPPLGLTDLQRLLDRLRRTYPPYFSNGAGGHCAQAITLIDQNGHPLAPAGSYAATDYQSSLQTASQPRSWKPAWAAHWQTLLAPMTTDHTPENGLGLRQFGDDRAAVMSYVAFDDVRALNRGQWVRLCFADDAGSDPLPYAESFLTDFERQHAYDRYWYTGSGPDRVIDSRDNPSRVLNCGYAFTYAGNQSCQYFFADARAGALFTFRHIYVHMGLVAHMQRAALLASSHRLAHLVERRAGNITLPNRSEVRAFYDQFIEFTQTYWFDELTPQEQGQQLFTAWQGHLRTRQLYDEVRQELRDLAEYSELRASADELKQSQQLNQAVGLFGGLSVLLALVSAVAGIFGMNDPAGLWGWLALPTALLFGALLWLVWRVARSRDKLLKPMPELAGLIGFNLDTAKATHHEPAAH